MSWSSETARPIDPKRPWIEDPRDAPAQLAWLPTLFWPFGRTSRLHFTRAWTVLFFARVLALVLPLLFIGIMAASGAEAPSPGLAFGIFGATVGLTLVCSFVLHLRRLADARRSALWAVLVSLPVILGLAVFIAAGSRANAAFDARQTAAAAGSGGEAVESASSDVRSDRRRGSQRGGRDNDPPATRQDAIVQAAGGPAILAWSVGLIGVTIWSLMWVGRLPTGGGTIRERLDRMPAQATD